MSDLPSLQRRIQLSYCLSHAELDFQARKDRIDALVNIFALEFLRRELPVAADAATHYAFTCDEACEETRGLCACYGVQAGLRASVQEFFLSERERGFKDSFAYIESDLSGRVLFSLRMDQGSAMLGGEGAI